MTKNGKLLQSARNNNDVKGFVLKADIKHYFQTVDHDVLLSMLRKKIKDETFPTLVKSILSHYGSITPKKGIPLGNWTSQFFANVYLNELDYFVKHKLHARYYIRYVDDFVLLHPSSVKLEGYRNKISSLLTTIKLELHENKTKIKRGVSFLGYRIFYHHKLLRKKNMWKIKKRIDEALMNYTHGEIDAWSIFELLESWSSYAVHGNTYKLRSCLIEKVKQHLMEIYNYKLLKKTKYINM